MEIRDKRVLSSDNIHELAGKVYIPDGAPCGLFHIVHGMQEHIGRYDSFMRDLAEEGFIVFGCDNLGHGHTAMDKSELGFIAHKDGWKHLVEDVAVFGDAVRKEYGNDLKYILLGHSMGSFIVRLAAVRDKHDKLIVLGTDGPRSEYIISQYYLSLLKAVKGERYISPMSKKLAFGKYNERFGNGDPLNWLTKNADVRDAYRADRLCTYDFTTGAYLDLVKLLRRCNTKKWAESLNKNKPVLLMSGTDDPVGHYGAGVRKVNDMLRDAGVPVTMKLYENCRHEVINETCYNDALEEILRFAND